MTMLTINQTRQRIVLYWIPLLIWMGFIFLLSSYNGATLEKTSKGNFGILPPIVTSAITSEVFVHTIEFAILTILVYRLLASRPAIRWRYVIAGSLTFAIGYGILDEFHQSFVPGRSSTLADVGLDIIGVLTGLLVAELGVRLRKTIGASHNPDIPRRAPSE